MPFAPLALIAFCACTPGTAWKPAPIALPDAWREAAAFPVTTIGDDFARWWSQFNDPVLDRLIHASLRQNPDAVSAEARVREFRARRDAARSTLFPAIDAGISGGSTRVNRDGNSGSATAFASALDASWEADLFGRNRQAVQAAAARLGSAAEALHSVHASLAAETALEYIRLRANQARLDVLLQNVKTREETARLAGWRRDAGEADALESSQASASLESARAAIPLLEQEIASGRNFLASLVGKNPGEIDDWLSPSRGIPVPPPTLASRIPADALRLRPDVRIAGYELLAAAASRRAAEAARFPSLRITGSLGTETPKAADFLDPRTTTANLLAGLTAPVLDAGRIRADIEASGALEDQTYENYRQTVLRALAETENALIACRRSKERLGMLEQAVSHAREADLLARSRYEVGEIDFLSVLDTQRTLLIIEESLLATRADLTSSVVRLYQALGGGWACSAST